MPLRELKEKYGGAGRNAINRAIRAECVGGAAALDALEASFQILRNARDARGEKHDVQLHNLIRDVIADMEADVCLRHNIKNENGEPPHAD